MSSQERVQNPEFAGLIGVDLIRSRQVRFGVPRHVEYNR